MTNSYEAEFARAQQVAQVRNVAGKLMDMLRIPQNVRDSAVRDYDRMSALIQRKAAPGASVLSGPSSDPRMFLIRNHPRYRFVPAFVASDPESPKTEVSICNKGFGTLIEARDALLKIISELPNGSVNYMDIQLVEV